MQLVWLGKGGPASKELYLLSHSQRKAGSTDMNAFRAQSQEGKAECPSQGGHPVVHKTFSRTTSAVLILSFLINFTVMLDVVAHLTSQH